VFYPLSRKRKVADDDFVIMLKMVFGQDFGEGGIMDKTSCTKPLRGLGSGAVVWGL
jgi:hypothetical protein